MWVGVEEGKVFVPGRKEDPYRQDDRGNRDSH